MWAVAAKIKAAKLPLKVMKCSTSRPQTQSVDPNMLLPLLWHCIVATLTKFKSLTAANEGSLNYLHSDQDYSGVPKNARQINALFEAQHMILAFLHALRDTFTHARLSNFYAPLKQF